MIMKSFAERGSLYVPVEQKDEVFWKEQEIVNETPEIKLHRFLLYLAVYVELSLYNI